MLLAYYGDDFTGSTDVLEALTTSGIPTVLFTEPPTPQTLSRFPQIQAIGIAGNSRTMSPDQMDAALPAVFESLLAQRPSVLHYKVCSTFDSSPAIGSIGRAIELGQRACDTPMTPLVLGSPQLQRFVVFGNLFARSGLDSPVHRLDRHPTMCRHPVTPMTEADLRLHLARQTSLPIELIDVLELDRGEAAANAMVPQSGIALFDTLTSTHLGTIGKVVSRLQEAMGRTLFVAGSSGVESALTTHWQTTGKIASESKGFRAPRAVDQAIMISGSCSPVTGRQIGWAIDHGVADVSLDTVAILQSASLATAIDSVVRSATSFLDNGRSIIIHTSRGPDDPRIAASKQTLESGLNREGLGVILGKILRQVLQSRPVERVAVAGGDTSGDIARTIGIEALEMAAPLAPGAPFCVAHSAHAAVDGVEFTFKGGQVGHDDFFGSLIRGESRQ